MCKYKFVFFFLMTRVTKKFRFQKKILIGSKLIGGKENGSAPFVAQMLRFIKMQM